MVCNRLMFVFFQDVAFTASPDATIRVWSVANASCTEIVKVLDPATNFIIYRHTLLTHTSLSRTLL